MSTYINTVAGVCRRL